MAKPRRCKCGEDVVPNVGDKKCIQNFVKSSLEDGRDGTIP
jgi:hypothetical protein